METTVARPPRFTRRVGERQPARRWAWPVTVVLHWLAAAAVVIVPLLGDEPLPPENHSVAKAFFVAPALAPAPPPPPAAVRAATAPAVARQDVSNAFTAPLEVAELIAADESMDIGIERGVPGGVEGGVPGGVVGGIVGGIEAAPPPPPQVVHVGGVIREPRKIKSVAPAYPSFARAAGIQGVVILECTISPRGKVEGAKVLRGVPMLDEAALEAVKQWVYAPTLVDGVPVAVVMTVTVNFVLREAMASRAGRGIATA